MIRIIFKKKVSERNLTNSLPLVIIVISDNLNKKNLLYNSQFTEKFINIIICNCNKEKYALKFISIFSRAIYNLFLLYNLLYKIL